MEKSAHCFFIPFDPSIDLGPISDSLQLSKSTYEVGYLDHPPKACLLAIQDLQHYLQTQNEWGHNFGLIPNQQGPIIGKMFGVLIVENQNKELGYLSAFSGKLSESNTFTRFVPPIFDTLTEDGFLNIGMKAISKMTSDIQTLKETKPNDYERQAQRLLKDRKAHSIALQQQLFENYHFLNQFGEEKSLISIFKDAGYANPPAGAGECAAPKLLQYAFQHQLKAITLTEFWWGQSPKSATWKHGQFYAPCKEKCEPILKHMLSKV